MKLAPHYAHEIVCARYATEDGEVANYSLECLDCNEVLFDEEAA
jgi:hypothetical protein